MKYRFLTLMAAVGVLLAGCNKDDSSKIDGADGTSDIYIQFTKPLSKAVADNVSDLELNFGEGGMFFTDPSDNILSFIRISTTGATGTFTIEQLEEGQLIKNISNKAERLYVIGNYDFSTKDYPTMAAIRTDCLTDLKDESDAFHGVSNATLFGSDKLVAFAIAEWPNFPSGIPVAEYPEKAVKVEVSPLLGRFEIDQVTANNTKYSATPIFEIDSYKIAGIYINNFYYTLDITGQNYDDFYDFGTDANKYQRAPGGSYLAAWESLLFDDNGFSADLGNALVIKPSYSDSKTWAYNFFPDANTTPQIVLHLTDLKVDYDDGSGVRDYENTTLGSGSDGVAYLTVRRYLSASDDSPVNLEGGYIFRMADLEFGPEDIGDEPGGPKIPEENDMTVWVEVQLIDWKVKQIKPGF